MRTDVIKALKEGGEYIWGKVRKIHSVGEYDIVEYHPWRVRSCVVLEGKPDYKEIRFHPYAKNVCNSRSFRTLDAALVGIIATKYDGINTRADWYFFNGVLANKPKRRR